MAPTNKPGIRTMNPDPRDNPAPTRVLASWSSTLRHDDVPARTRDVVRRAILDTVGCALHGYGTPWARMMLTWTRDGGNKREATVWGDTAPSLRAADAALANATAAHAFELDDYHKAKLHPGAVVVPAAVAMAEKLGADGKRLVTAIAAGYEVMIRSSLALNPSAARLRGWHLTGVCGPLGAAAACSSLLGLDAEETAWALGLAGTQGAGTWAFNADGTMSKRFHAGKAAHSGVMAAELAALRFTGPTQIYEFADGGILKAFSDASDPAPLTAGLGQIWHLDETCIKPYSCCGSAHAYIDAALALRAELGAPWDTSRRVKAGLPKVVQVQCGFDYTPGSALNAQMSVRYAIAAALIDGRVLPQQYTDSRMNDHAMVAVATGLQCEHDAALDQLYPSHFAGWVAAEHDGKWIRKDILDPLGTTANPVDARGVIEKFRGICPEAPVDAIAETALHIERHDPRELVAQLAAVHQPVTEPAVVEAS